MDPLSGSTRGFSGVVYNPGYIILHLAIDSWYGTNIGHYGFNNSKNRILPIGHFERMGIDSVRIWSLVFVNIARLIRYEFMAVPGRVYEQRCLLYPMSQISNRLWQASKLSPGLILAGCIGNLRKTQSVAKNDRDSDPKPNGSWYQVLPRSQFL